MSAQEKGYKDTLSLPQTSFPMRGDLVKNEPTRLAQWEEDGLYRKIVARRRAEGAPRFILHDGPPLRMATFTWGRRSTRCSRIWW